MRDPNFGAKMAALRRERGVKNPGRPAIRQKYDRQVASLERRFADALPELADEYLAELRTRAPEMCVEHRLILRCPVRDCDRQSERAALDFRAVQYVVDRIMGRPTSRSEGTLQVSFVQQMTAAFVDAFTATNDLTDPHARREAFAKQLLLLGEQYNVN